MCTLHHPITKSDWRSIDSVCTDHFKQYTVTNYICNRIQCTDFMKVNISNFHSMCSAFGFCNDLIDCFCICFDFIRNLQAINNVIHITYMHAMMLMMMFVMCMSMRMNYSFWNMICKDLSDSVFSNIPMIVMKAIGKRTIFILHIMNSFYFLNVVQNVMNHMVICIFHLEKEGSIVFMFWFFFHAIHSDFHMCTKNSAFYRTLCLINNVIKAGMIHCVSKNLLINKFTERSH